jgi:hypothetical protein
MHTHSRYQSNGSTINVKNNTANKYNSHLFSFLSGGGGVGGLGGNMRDRHTDKEKTDAHNCSVSSSISFVHIQTRFKNIFLNFVPCLRFLKIITFNLTLA